MHFPVGDDQFRHIIILTYSLLFSSGSKKDKFNYMKERSTRRESHDGISKDDMLDALNYALVSLIHASGESPARKHTLVEKLGDCKSVGDMIALADELEIGDAELRPKILKHYRMIDMIGFKIRAEKILLRHGFIDSARFPRGNPTREKYFKLAAKAGIKREDFERMLEQS